MRKINQRKQSIELKQHLIRRNIEKVIKISKIILPIQREYFLPMPI